MNQNENEITIDEIVDLFSARMEAGEKPSIDEFKNQYPQFADQLDAVLSALLILEDVDSQPTQRKVVVDESIPELLGEYQLIQEVGRGGMGIVFEAVHSTMRRRVALKVLPKSHSENPKYVRRFEMEARSAGQLHHTNIVPVFEVGESDGIHFYAMQFIHGENLDRVIDDVRLLRIRHGSQNATHDEQSNGQQASNGSGLSQLLAEDMIRSPIKGSDSATELFTGNDSLDFEKPVSANEFNCEEPYSKRKTKKITDTVLSGSSISAASNSKVSYHRRVADVGVQVAQALDYAHRHGVLHRDVKPANLILGTDGNVWVADFGLAKLESNELTRTGDIIGTLRYMAPERFSGDADGRSDIYGLGLTLYELCTLKCAFENDRGTLVKDVANSSNVVHPREIDETIPTDLETIILKAIEPQPERRYQTAGDLADDLQLFLADRPIKARRTTYFERLWRLCRRNPALASLTASSVILLLVVAIGSSLAAIRIKNQSQALQRQNEKAAQHLALTEQTIDKMLVRVGHDLADVPQTEAIRFQLYSDALELQSEILKLEPENTEVTINTVAAHRRMAEAQNRIGSHDRAMQTLEKTNQLIRSLPDDSTEKFIELANVQTLMAGAFRRQGDSGAAKQHMQQAMVALSKISQQQQSDRSRIRFAVSHRQLAALQHESGQVEEAKQSLQAALSALDAVGEDNDSHAEATSVLTDVLNSLAIIYRASGQMEQAEETYRRVLDLCRETSNGEIRDVESASQLGLSALNFGNMLLFQRRHDEAADAYVQAENIYQRLLSDFPMTVNYQRMTARTKLCMASVYSGRGEVDFAETAYRDAIEQCIALTSIHGKDAITFDTHAVALTNLGNLLKKQKRYDEAIDVFEESIDLREQRAAEKPDQLANIKSLALTQGNLAHMYIDLEEYESAYPLLLEAQKLVDQLLTKNPNDPSFVRVGKFVLGDTSKLMYLTGRYDQVTLWIAKRSLLDPESKSTALKSIQLLKGAFEKVNDDSTLNETARRQWIDSYSRVAIELVQKLTSQGWIPEGNEVELVEWMDDHPEIQKLLKSVPSISSAD